MNTLRIFYFDSGEKEKGKKMKKMAKEKKRCRKYVTKGNQVHPK